MLRARLKAKVCVCGRGEGVVTAKQKQKLEGPAESEAFMPRDFLPTKSTHNYAAKCYKMATQKRGFLNVSYHIV